MLPEVVSSRPDLCEGAPWPEYASSPTARATSPTDEVDRLGIEVVPLTIRFGDEEFTDRDELQRRASSTGGMAASDELPETAAPAPGAFEAGLPRAQPTTAPTPSCASTCPATCRPRCSRPSNAAQALEGEVDVRVVDSHVDHRRPRHRQVRRGGRGRPPTAHPPTRSWPWSTTWSPAPACSAPSTRSTT